MNPALILFDLDGTLIDSLRDLQGSVNHVLTLHGRPPLAEKRVRGYIGDGVRVLLARAFLGWEENGDAGAGFCSPEDEERERQAEIGELMRRAEAMGDPTLPQAVAAFREHYTEHLLDHTRCYPGVEEALAALDRRGVALGVVSNKPEAMSERILQALGLRPCLRLVLGGDSLPASKPDPAPLRRAMEELGAAPGETLMVGDSLNDLLAGRKAGCRTAVVTYGLCDHRRLLRYHPDLVLDDLRRLLPGNGAP